MSSLRSPIHLALVLSSLLVTGQACSPPPAAQRASTAPPTRQLAAYGNLPMRFEVNQGQSDEQVRFLARGQGYTFFLTAAEAVLSLRQTADVPDAPAAVVRMRLVGANANPRLTGIDPLPGTSNYFIGSDPARWQRDVPSYAKVKSAAVYPGVDLVYYGNQRQLEYDFVVAPAADPRRITLGFDGVQALSIDAGGNLVLRAAQGDLTQLKPVIYQDIGGERKIVDGRYVLRAADRVGFAVDSYDTTRPLIIDPVLVYSTYLGGNNNDIGYAIAVDTFGNAYVTGLTRSTNFPGASGSAIQATLQGSDDVFVTKINAAGTALVYSTYLGGSNGDIGFAIAVDDAGQAYVTGETSSTGGGGGIAPFPTVGAFQSEYHLGGDAFVTKLNALGNAIVYSTYLGGSGVERGYGIAVDGSGSAYVTGSTNSVNQPVPSPTNFPVVAAFQSQNGGNANFDAFVTKFNPAGNGLVYSTFLGGDASESSLHGGAIAVDSAGNAYVGGTTASLNFPGVGSSPIQSTNGGGVNDGFVVKFNAAGSGLVYSTYLGGNLYDAVNGIAIDAAQNVYVTGYTDSPNFPTVLPLQPTRNGVANDAFVSMINSAGTNLLYSTYLGGSGSDMGYAVAVDGAGRAFVSGFTSSGNFPMAAPLQGSYAGSGDAFISEITPGGALLFSTYWGGGSGAEHGHGIAVDGAGDPYVTGETNSFNFPASPGAFQTSLALNTDAFLVKFATVPTVLRPPTGLVANTITGNTVTIGWTAPADSITPTGYVLEGGLTPGSVLASIPTNSTATIFTFVAPSGAYYIRLHSLAGSQRSAASNEIRIFINSEAAPPSAPVNLQGTVTGNSLSLVWTNTAGGGTPTGLVLDVTGSLNATLGLPLSAAFSVASVPNGTYTLSLRAVNSAGSSASSNAVTLTFPGPCPVPGVPTNLSVTRSGSVLTASWGLPAGGSAPASYRVFVSGAFTGEFALNERSIAGSVGAGSYTISVAAANSCGTGPATPTQTVTVP